MEHDHISSIETELTYTPVFDGLSNYICVDGKPLGDLGALVFGCVWRYCQMSRGVCDAAVEKIASRFEMSEKTVRRKLDVLCAEGFLKDMTPDLRHKPHTYKDTGKLRMKVTFSTQINGEVGHRVQPGLVTESNQVGHRVQPGWSQSPTEDGHRVQPGLVTESTKETLLRDSIKKDIDSSNSNELGEKDLQPLFRDLIDESLTYCHAEVKDCYVYVDFGGPDLERYAVKSISPRRIKIVMDDKVVKQIDPEKTKVYYKNGLPNLGRVVIGELSPTEPSIPLDDEGKGHYEALLDFLPDEPSLMTDHEKSRFFKETREFAQRMQMSTNVKPGDMKIYAKWFKLHKLGYATITLKYILTTWNEAMNWYKETGGTDDARTTKTDRNPKTSPRTSGQSGRSTDHVDEYWRKNDQSFDDTLDRLAR